MVPGRGLVLGGEAPALLGAGRDGHEGVGDVTGLLRGVVLRLRVHGVRVGAVLGDRREPVVQVLGGVAHDQRARIDQPVGEEPRVGVGALTHRVMAHVLDAARKDDVVLAETDAGRGGRHGRHRAGAHAVDRESGDALGQPGEDGGGAADGQTLIAGLGGRGDRDVVDRGGIELRVATQQFTNRLDDEIVGASAGVHALRAGLAERGADAVDEHDIALGG